MLICSMSRPLAGPVMHDQISGKQRDESIASKVQVEPVGENEAHLQALEQLIVEALNESSYVAPHTHGAACLRLCRLLHLLTRVVLVHGDVGVVLEDLNHIQQGGHAPATVRLFSNMISG